MISIPTMPGKHVHFATTPSPSFSIASLPSSPGPLTPPPLNSIGSPYAYSPLPAVPSQVHPALGVALKPLLHFDVSLPPSFVQPSSSKLNKGVLHESALHPPVPYMKIVCSHLPWSISVEPTGKIPFVTVLDVLQAIYRSLRQNVLEAEFKTAPLNSQYAIDAAFKRRCMRLPGPDRETEHKKGLKRVDFLCEKTIFQGLASTSAGPETWQLTVS